LTLTLKKVLRDEKKAGRVSFEERFGYLVLDIPLRSEQFLSAVNLDQVSRAINAEFENWGGANSHVYGRA